MNVQYAVRNDKLTRRCILWPNFVGRFVCLSCKAPYSLLEFSDNSSYPWVRPKTMSFEPLPAAVVYSSTTTATHSTQHGHVPRSDFCWHCRYSRATRVVRRDRMKVRGTVRTLSGIGIRSQRDRPRAHRSTFGWQGSAQGITNEHTLSFM